MNDDEPGTDDAPKQSGLARRVRGAVPVPPPSDPADDDDIAPDEPAPAPAGSGVRPVGRTVRIGCVVLGVFGLLSLYAGATTAADPEQVRCDQARFALEDEGDVEDADDIECDAAVADAEALADEDDDVILNTESFIRTRGLIWIGMGIVQAVGGVLTGRTRAKGPRMIALVGAGMGIVFSPLGLIGIPILGFVVYAIFFSADARAVFGEPGGSRLFRPRGPRTQP